MNITFRQLEIVVAAADAGSFSKAAETLSISQPALSEAIRRIENEIGLRLFDRTTRSLALTLDGRHAVAIARGLVRDARLAFENIAARGSAHPARISIAALPSVACSVLPQALRDFATQYPNVSVSIHDVQHERAIALIADGRADLAVTFKPMKLDRLAFEEIASDGMHLVCRKDHPLARHERVRWRDIGEHAFIGMTGISSVRRLTDAAFVNSEAIPAARYEVEQIPSAAALVEAGLGVTALPALTFPMFRSSALVMRPLIEPKIRRRMGFLQRAGRASPEPVQALASAVRTHLRRILKER